MSIGNSSPTAEVSYLRLAMSSNSTEQCHPPELHPAIPAVLAILSTGGLVFNAFSLWIFWFTLKRWSSGVMLQFNLALADAIILPVTPLTVAYFSLGNHWPFGEFLCQFQVFLLSTHLYGSIYFLMLISVHRYQATVHYNARSLWKKKSFLKKLVMVFWVLLFLQGFPVFFSLKTSVIDSKVKCLSIYQSELSELYLAYSIVLGTLCFLLPFGVSSASYVMLGMAIANISQANLRGRVMKAKSIQMITIALVIFAVCFTPLHICGTVAAIAGYYNLPCGSLHNVEIAYYLSVVFTMVNCCLDPFLYNAANEKFHKFFFKSLGKLLFSK
nr:PREDICTED: P2Y purinoceptor 2-like [Anolis carolinensis]|eukprot:XP_003228390.1 PREDICTED: P2Y purinoceptor 2-like [Anolis carolinensis]